MQKLVLFWVFILSVAGGVGYRYIGEDPYQLNYKRVALNLPITYNKYLKMDTYALGEKYLSEDLAAELKRQGMEPKLYTFEETSANSNFLSGYEIFMRHGPELLLGYHDLVDKDRIAVLFETIPYELNIVKEADIVLTGSLKKEREYRGLGINAHFLPQFTRLDKFYYAPREELKTKVLFVANQWDKMAVRKSVAYAMRTGVELAVYGSGWHDILAGSYYSWLKADQIPGEYLKYYYSSADIVLNDTRDDMIKAGFISNRIFDATACKAFVISDYIPEIEEIYGDSVPMYKNEQEFKALIEYYLAHPEERREKALKAHKITIERFSAEKVVGKMLEIMEDYRLKNKFGVGE